MHRATQMFSLMVGRTLGFACAMAVPLIVVRLFTVQEFALYKQVFLISGTIGLVLNMGIGASLYYLLPQYPGRSKVCVGQALLAFLVAGGIVSGMVALGKHEIAMSMNNPELERYLPVIVLIGVFMLVGGIWEIVLTASQRAELAGVVIGISELGKAICIAGGALVLGEVKGVVIAILLFAIIKVVSFVTWGIKRDVLGRFTLDRMLIKLQWGFAAPFAVAVVARAVADGLPQYLVASMTEPVTFAIFSVGCLDIALLGMWFDSVAEPTLVQITRYVTEGKTDAVAETVRHAMKKVFVVFVPIFVFAVAYAHEIIVALFSEKFVSSVPVFQVFTATILVGAMGLDYVPRAFGNSRFVMYVNIFRAFLTAVAVVGLYRILGLVGAALGLVVGLAVTKAVILGMATRLTKTSVGTLVPWKALAQTSAIAVVAVSGSISISQFAWGWIVGRLAIAFPIFTIVYMAMVWRTDAFEEDDREWVRGLSKRLSVQTGRLLSVTSQK